MLVLNEVLKRFIDLNGLEVLLLLPLKRLQQNEWIDYDYDLQEFSGKKEWRIKSPKPVLGISQDFCPNNHRKHE